ncbi:MAG: N-acetyl-gamma-glutamyl-phosphate reductase [Parvibaculales bacterium]
MSDKIAVAIIGASGYTGADAIRLLATHPHVEIKALTANAHAGRALSEVFPQFGALDLPVLQKVETVDWSSIDAALCGLPHGTAQDVIQNIPERVKVIDMSADFRLKDAQIYADWYGRTHEAEDLLGQAVYGLSEHYRADIQKARLVACPGCYPTAALTLLLPLVKGGLISVEDLIIDAKSGVTGAGRSVKESNLFCEVAEGLSPYGVGSHRHAPEIEQELGLSAGTDVMVNFTPHLVPMNRGELLTVYAKTNGADADALRKALLDDYATEPFINVLPSGETPSTRQVRGSNYCNLAVFEDRLPGRVILVSTLDNLVKGSSGQAVQNLNIMFGFDETDGLQQQPLYP